MWGVNWLNKIGELHFKYLLPETALEAKWSFCVMCGKTPLCWNYSFFIKYVYKYNIFIYILYMYAKCKYNVHITKKKMFYSIHHIWIPMIHKIYEKHQNMQFSKYIGPSHFVVFKLNLLFQNILSSTLSPSLSKQTNNILCSKEMWCFYFECSFSDSCLRKHVLSLFF